jgi:hypothetical protein
MIREPGRFHPPGLADFQTPDMISPLHSVTGALLVFVVASMGNSDADACQRAATRYEIAVTDVIDALHNYEKCLVASRGRDPCLEEFSDLDLAQDRFETAVSEDKEACQ